MQPLCLKTAYIGLGSNLGDRHALVGTAIARLAEYGSIVAVSNIHETEPLLHPLMPFHGAQNFLNACIALQTAIPPKELLIKLLALETSLGRNRDEFELAWGPRVIDLDLLAVDDLVANESMLVLPHPRLAERRFVLAPLAEIAPDWRHPISGLSISEMLVRLDSVE